MKYSHLYHGKEKAQGGTPVGTAALDMNKVLAAYAQIESKRKRPWQGEEEVRIAWISALESALGVTFDAERAKKDSSYRNVIIEFKSPGAFNGSKESPKFREAIYDRLLPYIKREAEKTGIPESDFIGIAIDGEHICFAQVQGDEIHTQHLIPFSPQAVYLVCEAVAAQTRRAVTAKNLIDDFGLGSPNAVGLLQALSDVLAAELASPENSKIKMLYEEWRTLYGQVSDMSQLQADAIDRDLNFTWNGPAEHAMSGRLFVIHTYNSLFIKLLAAEIVSAHHLTTIQQPAQAMTALLDDEALLDALERDIERGGIFTQAGIIGFVEEALFSWYLDAARSGRSENLIPALRRLLATLTLYRTDKLTGTRDVLRDLYQNLVPAKLRQSLGEFYTPDWLVEYTVDRLENGSWLNRRVLDPTCGSGAFLVSLIHRVRQEAEAAGWSKAEIAEYICRSVWGFDLNPLAVQTSRVNYLMAIADLLSPGQRIEIPILMADAIYSPAPNPASPDGVVTYRIGSQVANLEITLPAALASNRPRLDQVFAVLGEQVEADHPYPKAEEALVASGLLTPEEADAWREPLSHTYTQILELHRKRWNGIWFRIVRNFFWSATAGEFDLVVGNPPWVRWSKLPEAYRERVKPTCEQYGIFSRNKRHGGNELDISAMITYTVADKWLRLGGRLAFVITGTLFKNPSSEGFRQFALVPSDPQTPYLRPISVDDLKALKPFPDASNHTTVAVFDKAAEPGTYPIPYREWDSIQGFSKAIPPDLSLPDVMQRVSITEKEAAPVSGNGSPWAVLTPGRFSLLGKLSGTCDWAEGHKGITTDLNGVYFVPILQVGDGVVQVRSRPEAGKKDIGPARTAWVEPDLLYPLIKGAADFEACYLRLDNPNSTEERLYAFVPNQGITNGHYMACEVAMNSPGLQQTKAWFANYRKLLLNRSTYRRQMQGAPYYAVYNVGEYTFKPWKVIWPEMSNRFYAAVAGSAPVPGVGPRPYVPDHKIYFVSFDTKEPAYYLCGLLNSSLVREWVESHTISIQVGDIFKHLRLPSFDPGDSRHLELATRVEAAHALHDADQRRNLVAEITALADQIVTEFAQSV